jgi:hypothetical protein
MVLLGCMGGNKSFTSMTRYIVLIFCVLVACTPPKRHHPGDVEPAHERHVAQTETLRVFDNVHEGLQIHIFQMLHQYYALREALVEADPMLAGELAGKMIDKSMAFDKSVLGPEQRQFYLDNALILRENGAFIQSSRDIDIQRAYFPALTAAMYNLVRAFQANADPVYYQYCPQALDQKGAGWLSESEEIRNPYFGFENLRCGSVVEVVE